jgi:hypothetical protein
MEWKTTWNDTLTNLMTRFERKAAGGASKRALASG